MLTAQALTPVGRSHIDLLILCILSSVYTITLAYTATSLGYLAYRPGTLKRKPVLFMAQGTACKRSQTVANNSSDS
jgi:hypothetical protein